MQRLHYFQSQAITASINENVPFVGIISGVQGGKSTAGAAWLTLQAQLRPRGDHLICAPTYKILQHSTLRKFDAIFPKGWANFNKAEQVYDLRSGGKIFVRSLEDPDSIEGLSAASVWMDEAGKCSVRGWENVQARRSATRGPVFLTTTPYGLNWLKDQFYDLWLKGLPEYRVIHFRSIDSPHFSAEEYTRLKRDTPPKVFRRKYDGIFTPLEGLIYEQFERDTMECPLPSVPRHWERIGCIDHGHTEGHEAAIGIWASPNFHDGKSKVWKVAEFKKAGMLMRGLFQVMQNFQAFTGPVRTWYADPAAAQENAELRNIAKQAGVDINIRAAVNAVDWGIEQVQGLMHQDRYRLAKGRCKLTIDELSVYARDEKDRVIKENDHLMDADRYGLATHMRPAKRIEVH